MNLKHKKLSALLLFLFTPFVSIAQESNKKGLDDKINEAFKPIANWFEAVILHDFPFTASLFGTGIPTIIILLVGGALFFTIYFGFVNIRHFPTAIKKLRACAASPRRGDDNDNDTCRTHEGHPTATAVSGTVGNGNIAGVALAIALGGPGATFWMIICGLIGMSTKFVECTLGVQYRDVDENELFMEVLCIIFQKV